MPVISNPDIIPPTPPHTQTPHSVLPRARNTCVPDVPCTALTLVGFPRDVLNRNRPNSLAMDRGPDRAPGAVWGAPCAVREFSRFVPSLCPCDRVPVGGGGGGQEEENRHERGMMELMEMSSTGRGAYGGAPDAARLFADIYRKGVVLSLGCVHLGWAPLRTYFRLRRAIQI